MKILPTGFAVIEGDRWLSAWIEERGNLAIDGIANEAAARFIKPGDVVVDAGASLGDTTAAFLHAVGPTGTVYAFEPNPETFEALKHNCPSAICRMVALGCFRGKAVLNPDHENIGQTWVDKTTDGIVHVMPLDELDLERLNFLKIDVEGLEPDVLTGGNTTIRKCRPVILMEVNHGALKRSGFTVEDIIRIKDTLGYDMELADSRYGLDQLQTDVYLIPK